MSGYHDSYGGSGGGGYHHHGGYSNPNNAVNAGTGTAGTGAATNNYNPSGDVVYPSYYGYEDDDYPSSDSSSSEGNILDVEETEADDEEDENVVDFDDPSIADLPRILLMGPRRAGKTSIQRVVFHKMSPHETLFRLEATQNLERAVVDHTPLCRFTIWDFPGDYYGPDYTTTPTTTTTSSPNDNNINNNNTSTSPHHHPPSSSGQEEEEEEEEGENQNSDAYIFGRATALIFVIDAQDEPYDHVLQNFTETVTRAIRANPHLAMEVFINKVDGELFLSDDAKYECRRDVMTQVAEDLADAGVPPDSVSISYHLTSIYDHSVFEAFSRVVQKLIPQLPTLENLLNVLVSTCSMEKAYLFDVASKLYISTDSSPVDMQSVELCSDMIDVVLDVSGIYGHTASNKDEEEEEEEEEHPNELHHDVPNMVETDDEEQNNMNNTTTTAIPSHIIPVVTNNDVVDVDEDGKDELVGTLISSNPTDEPVPQEEEEEEEQTYDPQSSSIIRLSNGMILYLKEVDTMLALVCLTRMENFQKKSLINYNIRCLKKALKTLVMNHPPQPQLQQH